MIQFLLWQILWTLLLRVFQAPAIVQNGLGRMQQAFEPQVMGVVAGTGAVPPPPMDTRFADLTKNKWTRARKIAMIVLHGTVSGSAVGTIRWMLTANVLVAWHYTIDRDGTIFLTVSPIWKVIHAGKETLQRVLNLWNDDINHASIGIEFVDWNDGTPLTQAQIEMGAWLVAYLCQTQNVPVDSVHIATHYEITKQWAQATGAKAIRKTDPMKTRFDTNGFIARVQAVIRSHQQTATRPMPGTYRSKKAVDVFGAPRAGTPVSALAATVEVYFDVIKADEGGGSMWWGHLYGPSGVRNLGFVALVDFDLVSADPRFVPGWYQTTANVFARTGAGQNFASNAILVKAGTQLEFSDFAGDAEGKEHVPGIHLWGLVASGTLRGRWVYMGYTRPAMRQNAVTFVQRQVARVLALAEFIPFRGAPVDDHAHEDDEAVEVPLEDVE